MRRGLVPAIASFAAAIAMLVPLAARANVLPGQNGTFTTTLTPRDPTFPSSRDRIDIDYKADPAKVVCSKILISQTYVVRDLPGDPIFPGNIPGLEYANNWVTWRGTVIDMKTTAKDPYINGDDKAHSQLGPQGSSNGTTSTISHIFDAPIDPDGAFPATTTKMTTTFETCAICADDGKILDCITWKYSRTKGAPNTGTITDASTIAPPSVEFGEALKNFVTAHTGTDGKPMCPEAKAVQNPNNKNATPGVEKIVPDLPHPGQPSQIDWRLRSVSLAPLNSLQWVALLDDGHQVTPIAGGTVPSFACLGTEVVSFSVPPVPPGGSFVVTMRLDPNNLIPEYDETDNDRWIALNDQGLVGVGEARADLGLRLAVHPNPFERELRIDYTLPAPGHVRLQIFDPRGALVRTVVDGLSPAGPHRALWNGRDARNRLVPGGIYYGRLSIEGASRTVRIVHVR